MDRLGGDYRAQLVLSTLQCCLILGGTFLVGAFAKATMGVGSPSTLRELPVVHFIRYGGIILLVIPFSWTVLTILAERSDYWWATPRFTLASGTTLLIALGTFYFWATYSACMHPYQRVGPIQAIE